MAIVVIGQPFNKVSGGRNRKVVSAQCLLCGKEFEPRVSEVAKIKSCGCGGRFKKTHGKARARVYKIHKGMIARCSNPKAMKYKLYGGRGIQVCDRWLKFENFLADMGEPKPGESLDRIDPNGNYEPGNCRWADKILQANNKRTNKVIEIDGVSKTVAEWVRGIGNINYSTVTERLDRGWEPRLALFGKS